MPVKGEMSQVTPNDTRTLTIFRQWQTGRRAFLALLTIVVVIGSISFDVSHVRSFRRHLTVGPSATVSDLYPRWRGTRDLLLQRKNPYTTQQAAVYAEKFYGGQPDPTVDPSGYQGFSYPLYLSVILTPFVLLPFWIVQILFTILLTVLILWLTFRWMSMFDWPTDQRARWLVAFLVLFSYPSAFLIALQQPSGLVFASLLLSAWEMREHRFARAGVFLALAMVKPQLALLPALGAIILATRQGRFRSLASGFIGTMSLLLISSFMLLYDWPLWFTRQVRSYASTNSLSGALDALPSGIARSGTMGLVLLITLAACALIAGRSDDDHDSLVEIMALCIAATLIVNPSFLIYNLAFLAIPLTYCLRLLRDERSRWVRLPIWGSVFFAALGVGTTTYFGFMSLAGGTLPRTVTAAMAVFLVTAIVPLWLALVTRAWIRGDRSVVSWNAWRRRLWRSVPVREAERAESSS